MNFPTICVIKTTSTDNDKHSGISESKWNEEYLSYINLKNDIEDYCEFLKIRNINELFMMINVFIKPNDQYIINIEDLHYNEDYVYQAIFKSPIPNSTYQTLIDDSNKLATQMLNEKHIVDGDMILIKRCINGYN